MSRTVLICDDAMFMRNRIRDALRGSDYEVVGEAEDGQEAVEQFERLKPDVVTMDIVMPRKTGIEAVREIVGNHPDARILMCTAIGQETYLQQALSAGAVGYVIKPFKAEAVQTALWRAFA
jgi:two-component system chemotaxis response regulator CheY